MSENPVTPPEVAGGMDTQEESLLSRLRKITGVTEMPPLLDEKPKKGSSAAAPVDRFLPGLARIAAVLEHPAPTREPASANPPVDKLIPWLRDVFAACVAAGIAVLVALAVGVLWLKAWCVNAVQRGMLRWRERTKAKSVEAPAPSDDAARTGGRLFMRPPAETLSVSAMSLRQHLPPSENPHARSNALRWPPVSF